MMKMIKNVIVSGMQIGVGIIALVGLTNTLSPLSSVFADIGTWANGLFGIEVFGFPVGSIVGILGGIGFFSIFWLLFTGKDFLGISRKASKPGAGLKEITGTAKGIISSV